MTQPAISHARTRLRDLIGDPLFVRRGNGLEPTRRALELAPKIDEILHLSQAAFGTASEFDPRTSTRHFRIAAPDYVCTLLAGDLLRRFEQHAPTARFSFSLALSSAALEALTRDEIDATLRKREISRRVVASVPRLLIALSLVAESDALATVPFGLATRHAQAFGLQVLPPPFPLEPFPIVALTRRRADPGVEWLVAQLQMAPALQR